MNALRCPVLLALAFLMLSAGYCKERTEATEIEDQTLLSFIMEIIQNLKGYKGGESNSVEYFSKGDDEDDHVSDREALPDYGLYHEERRVEIVPRDLRMKNKFLNHLTGPLYFSPKCSKHFHRLYHTTRDCTIPAFYKRCARLLTRLAVSPMCMDG
uniref:ALK and LTK ligand 2 n=1 Tax=Geotrypetes seraphini TaxID=260995 RepID=A0A6P8PT28_GEOSA|nr:ALK and LTK ligand 2 [Geotrypetes seraphini]XP_033791407.1 ALK and LTK ligand 2 [Geotrypetes seraphini]XP_033791408.1 ALK and LTK ligand 2 [Geotrypetes seraphini]